jgi:hypothetical protein
MQKISENKLYNGKLLPNRCLGLCIPSKTLFYGYFIPQNRPMLRKIELTGYTISHGHLIFGHRLWLRWGESYSTVATKQNENPFFRSAPPPHAPASSGCKDFLSRDFWVDPQYGYRFCGSSTQPVSILLYCSYRGLYLIYQYVLTATCLGGFLM